MIERRPRIGGTKAEVLEALARTGFRVPPSLHFSVATWRRSPESILGRISQELHGARSLAVRSSCAREDQSLSSMAGAFHSVLGVPGGDAERVREAIAAVVESYGEHDAEADQVLVQPMIEGILISGVIMTRHLDDGSPYYVVNYDDESGRTDTVTGGTGTVTKTVYVFRGFRNSDFDSPRLLRIVRLARQLEGHLGCDALDIEFCMDRESNLHVLQVRPIAAASRWPVSLDEQVCDRVSYLEEFLARVARPRPGIRGGRTILGVMPDWNPAEILGLAPRPLAVSLYRHLVTARTWAEARESMGYRALPPEELMLLVSGRPFIDVRNSFNSFLPEGLGEDAGNRIVDAWLDRLDAHPEFHDKIEFEVAQTVADPAFEREYEERYRDVLARTEFERYRDLLRDLTTRAVDPGPGGSLAGAMERIAALEARQAARIPASPAAGLEEARVLLHDARALGALPFAVAARHAFIAEKFLRSAVAAGALSSERLQMFKSGIRTISGEYGRALEDVHRGRIPADSFLARFGHLRPGTYDALSPRYDADPDSILSAPPPPPRAETGPFSPTASELAALDALLADSGSRIGGKEFLDYACRAVAGREFAKFVFTRGLSDAIEALCAWGAANDLSREEISWLDLEDLLRTLSHPPLTSPRDWFQPRIEAARSERLAGRRLQLGYLIRSPRDVYVMPQHRSAPNFVARRRVEGEVVHLDGSRIPAERLDGAIVCIRNADPGFDWLFSRGIAGLVTQFGGTNSHMAIRCSEYGIPAAIGCGELLFERVRRASRCLLDAENQVLRPVEAP